MKRQWLILVAIVLAASACGGSDDSADDNGDNGNDGNTSVESDRSDSGFSESDLPEGFPSELIPPSYSSGEVVEFGGRTVVTFTSDLSFEDAAAHYDSVLGAGTIVEGEDRLGTWQGTEWIVSILDEDPIEIGVTKI